MYENVCFTSRILSLLCLKQKQCKYKPRGFFFSFICERIEIFMLIQTKFVQTICLELFSYQIVIFPNTRTRSDSQKFLRIFIPLMLIFYSGQKSFFSFRRQSAWFLDGEKGAIWTKKGKVFYPVPAKLLKGTSWFIYERDLIISSTLNLARIIGLGKSNITSCYHRFWKASCKWNCCPLFLLNHG